MRRARGWTQKELAVRVGVSQSRIVVLEQWCGNVSLKTLRRIAVVFDVALIVRFVSWGEFFLTLGREPEAPSSFDEEHAALARTEASQ